MRGRASEPEWFCKTLHVIRVLCVLNCPVREWIDCCCRASVQFTCIRMYGIAVRKVLCKSWTSLLWSPFPPFSVHTKVFRRLPFHTCLSSYNRYGVLGLWEILFSSYVLISVDSTARASNRSHVALRFRQWSTMYFSWQSSSDEGTMVCNAAESWTSLGDNIYLQDLHQDCFDRRLSESWASASKEPAHTDATVKICNDMQGHDT